MRPACRFALLWALCGIAIPSACTVFGGYNIFIQRPSRCHVGMAKAALDMTQRYIAPMTNTLVIMEKCKDCSWEQKDFHARLLTHFLQHLEPTLKLQLFFARGDDKPWDYNLFVVDSVRAFRELRLNIPETLHEREFFFLIVLTIKPVEKESYRRHMMKRIFRICLDFNVKNAVIMVQRQQEASFEFSYSRLNKRTCELQFKEVHVNFWRNGRLEHDYLFPPHVRTLHNCPLNVCAHVLHPFLSFYGNQTSEEHTRDLTRISGIDGDLLKILAKSMHFQIRLNIPQEMSNIDAGGNSTGCFRQLETKTASIAIGGYLHSQANYRYFSASLPYHQSPMVFVVRSTLQFGPFKQLAKPFCGGLWIAMFGTMLLASLVIRLMRSFASPPVCDFVLGPHNRYPYCTMIVILLGNPITRLPRQHFARFLLMMWMLLTLLMRNAYQGKMFDALRISQRLPMPRTIAELIERDYMLISSHYVDYYPRNRTIIQLSLGSRYGAVMASQTPMATISMRDTLAFFNEHNWHYSCLTYVREPIYTFQLAMFFRKHSYLRTAFDHNMKALSGAGITAYIAKKHVKRKFEIYNQNAVIVSKINNHMLLGLYGIYFALNVLAFFVFCLERRARNDRLGRFFDWVHFR